MEEERVGETNWLCNDVIYMCSHIERVLLQKVANWGVLSSARRSWKSTLSLLARDIAVLLLSSPGLLIAHSKATRKKQRLPPRPHKGQNFCSSSQVNCKTSAKKNIFFYEELKNILINIFMPLTHSLKGIFWESILQATVTSAKYSMENSQGACSVVGKRVNRQVIK